MATAKSKTKKGAGRPAQVRAVARKSGVRGSGASPLEPRRPTPERQPPGNASGESALRYEVTGQLHAADLPGFGGLTVSISEQRLAGEQLLDSTAVRPDGSYSVSFRIDARREGDLPDLVARVRAADRQLAASDVLIDAAPGRIVLDIAIPAGQQPAKPEADVVLDQLLVRYGKRQLPSIGDDRFLKDLAYLAAKTGLDARALAMGRSAFLLAHSESAKGALPPQVIYALLRAGVPQGDAFRLPPARAREIWEQAAVQGVIAAPKDLDEVTRRYAEIANRLALTVRPTGGTSSLGELLDVSFGKDGEGKARFAALLAGGAQDDKGFWTRVDKEFGMRKGTRLRLDAQIAKLAFGNARVLAHLQRHLPEGSTSLEPLARKGFARKEAWLPIVKDSGLASAMADLQTAAGADAETVKGAGDATALELATRLRRQFPTAALAADIESGILPTEEKAAGKVVAFLDANGKAFRFGTEPLEQYLERTSAPVDKAAREALKRIERVYQITPTDEAMNVLLAQGLHSAYQVAQFAPAEFVQRFGKRMGGAAVALKVIAKAQEVRATLTNVALAYQSNRALLPLGTPTAPLISGQVKQQALLAASRGATATLESLFGELDYCACEHCRSVLSPAAYFVNLLQLCDPVDNPPAGKRRPIDELLWRRPDLEQLPLTCANTNKVIKHIDLVNETLEYFVDSQAKQALDIANFSGFSTDASVPDANLLAEPQNVRASAYTALANAKFPLLLPFSEPLEQIRRYLQPSGTTLSEAMEALRVDDRMDVPSPQTTPPIPYAWRDVLLEELGIAPAELQLLTDRTLTVRELYGFPPAGTGDPAVPVDLRNARTLSRRLGLTYEDLKASLQTWFINPGEWVIAPANRLGVTLRQIKDFSATADNAANNSAFEAQLSAGLNPADYGGPIAAWVRSHAGTILGLLTLYDTAAEPDPCDFSKMELRYGDPAANGGQVRNIEFVRLIRFLRIWRHLEWPRADGAENPVRWSIADADAAIRALYPLDQLPIDAAETVNLQRLDAGCRVLVLRLGALRRLLRLLEVSDSAGLRAVLACIAPMQGTGETSLYQSLFMSAGFLQANPAFGADASGRPLGDAAALLSANVSALQAALQLSPQDYALIVADVGAAGTAKLATQFTDADADARIGRTGSPDERDAIRRMLRTELVSRIFARAWLARRLRVGVEELLQLSRCAGLSLEAKLDAIAAPGIPNDLEALVTMCGRIRAAGLQVSEALLLFWGVDLVAAGESARSAALSAAQQVRADLGDVNAQLVPTEDPDSGALRQLMSTVLGESVANRYLEYVEQRATNEVPYSHAAGQLSAAIQQAAGGGLKYDALRKTLAYTKGVMSAAVRNALLALGQPQAFYAAIAALASKSAEFFDQLGEPGLRLAHDTYLASNAAPEVRRRELFTNALAVLAPLRRQQIAIERVAKASGIPIGWLRPLLLRPELMCAADNPTAAAVNDFLAIGEGGLAGEYFFNNAIGGVPDQGDATLGSIDYGAQSPRSLPANPTAGQPLAARWSGYLAAPADGLYNLEIELDAAAAQPALTLDGSVVALQISGAVWRNTAPLNLAAGQPVPFALAATGVKARVQLRWQAANLALGVVPAGALFERTATDRVIQTYVRALRAQVMREKLNLGVDEAVSLYALPSLVVNLASGPRPVLGASPVLIDPPGADRVQLGRALVRVLAYREVRDSVGATAEEMIGLVQSPAASLAADATFSKRSGWSVSAIDPLLTRMGLVAGGNPDRSALRDPVNLLRAHRAVRVMRAVGIDAVTALARLTSAPSLTDAQKLYAALKAQHSASDWAQLATPINDSLRAARRDALVAFALAGLANDVNRQWINTADRLYEYLLLDVQMHPRVETSRIRQAIATVQQFIQRLVELPGTEAADIHIPLAMREQWPWMKRYRVWEANRKVFLYPENWLEPELRDDTSEIFRATMSELLQGDITEERAAEALVEYLRKLEEVARLEPCGIHLDTRETSDTADDVVHVIARTEGAHRKYYYRRGEATGWTPWEQVKLDIEDNPVLPVRWKGRLFLFWLKIIQEAVQQEYPTIPPGNATGISIPTAPDTNKLLEPVHNVKAVLCWSEYARGKWGPMRTSSLEQAVKLDEFTAPTGSKPFVREAWRLQAIASAASLDILIQQKPEPYVGRIGVIGFRLHNAFADPDPLPLPLPLPSPSALLSTATTLMFPVARNVWTAVSRETIGPALRVTYSMGVALYPPPPEAEQALFRRKDGYAGKAVAPQNDPRSVWHQTAPFLYSDAKFAFYVTPTRVVPSQTLPWHWRIPNWKFSVAKRQFDVAMRPGFKSSQKMVALDDKVNYAVGTTLVNKFGVVPKQ